MYNYKLSMQSRNAQQISMFAARFVKVLSERISNFCTQSLGFPRSKVTEIYVLKVESMMGGTTLCEKSGPKIWENFRLSFLS